jgi:hypothetical protein
MLRLTCSDAEKFRTYIPKAALAAFQLSLHKPRLRGCVRIYYNR